MHAEPRQEPNDAKAVRSVAAIGLAKAWFLVTGLAQAVLLPVMLGQGGYGVYRRALAIVNVPNNVVIAAGVQGGSRAIAAASLDARPATLRALVRVHVVLGVAIGGALAASVPLVAWLQRAPEIVVPLLVLSIVLCAYNIYAPLVGALNGTRAFGRQAALDAAFSTSRTVASIAVGFAFVRAGGSAARGAIGASIGFAAVAIAAIPIAALAIPWRHAPRLVDATAAGFDIRAHLRFLGRVAIVQASIAWLLQLDVVLLGPAAVDHALASGAPIDAARANADQLVGLYGQAQSFALLPFQLLTAATLVLFPAVHAATLATDRARLVRTIATGGRLSLVIGGAMVAAIASSPAAVLTFVFGAHRAIGDARAATDGADVLRILALAHGGTAIVSIGTTILVAGGRTARATKVAILSAALATVGAEGAIVLSRAQGLTLLHAGASGLAMGLFLAAIVATRAVGRELAPLFEQATIVRVVAAIAAAMLLVSTAPTPTSRLAALVLPIAGLVTYVVALALAREPTLSELLRLTRRRASPRAPHR